MCSECDRPFEPYARAEGYQRFCGPACRAAWHRRTAPAPAKKKSKPTRAERILDRLRQGPATGLDLLKAGGGTRYGARIKELRDCGHVILGPLPWTRLGDGYRETRTTEATPEGHEVYELGEP